jgi:hypothetical protein
MPNYDEALSDYTQELLMQIRDLNSEVASLRTHLSECYRQIALLQDQLRHYYL